MTADPLYGGPATGMNRALLANDNDDDYDDTAGGHNMAAVYYSIQVIGRLRQVNWLLLVKRTPAAAIGLVDCGLLRLPGTTLQTFRVLTLDRSCQYAVFPVDGRFVLQAPIVFWCHWSSDQPSVAMLSRLLA